MSTIDLDDHHGRCLHHGRMVLWYDRRGTPKPAGRWNDIADPSASGSKPTATSSEQKIGMAPGSMPWQTDDTADDAQRSYKYKYHPGGDPRREPKEAPSALHSVIVPNVTLPKVCS